MSAKGTLVKIHEESNEKFQILGVHQENVKCVLVCGCNGAVKCFLL